MNKIVLLIPAAALLAACSHAPAAKERAVTPKTETKVTAYAAYRKAITGYGYTPDNEANAKLMATAICKSDAKTIFAFAGNILGEEEKQKGSSPATIKKISGEIYYALGSVATGYCPEHGAVVGDGIAFFKGLHQF